MDVSGREAIKAEVYATPVKQKRRPPSSSSDSIDDVPHDDVPSCKPLTMSVPGQQLAKLNVPSMQRNDTAEKLLINLNKLKAISNN